MPATEMPLTVLGLKVGDADNARCPLCRVGRAVAAETGWLESESEDFRQEIKKGMQEQAPHAFRTY